MSNSLRYNVIDVISYARFFGGMLSIAECIHLHQWAQQGVEPSAFLKSKFYVIKSRIVSEKWERPEYQYNSQLRLMYRNSKMVNFNEVPKPKNINF